MIKKAQAYLDRINRENPHFIKLFNGTIIENKNVTLGYFAKGDSSEVFMYIRQYAFLLETISTIEYYILAKSKKK